MEEMTGVQNAGLMAGKKEQDRAVFERVWKRVMAEDGAAAPEAGQRDGGSGAGAAAAGIEVLTADQAPEPEGAGGDRGERTGAGPDESTRALIPAVLPDPPKDKPQGDFPKGGGVLGEGCRESIPLLQELIRRALEDGRDYQTLARRSGGGVGRIFGQMAGQARQNARELSAAYFLISGVRYWPESGPAPQLGSYLGELRRRFIREQETMTACLTGAEATADPCLGQMLWTQAGTAWERACKLRTLVEQA